MMKKHISRLLSGLLMTMILGMTNIPVLAMENKTIIVDGKVFAVSRDCKGENWRFDSDEHTLFLEGYEGMYIDLGTQDEVTIDLSGTNKVVSNIEAPAIRVTGSLKVEGAGSLELSASGCHAALFAQEGSLTITDTTVSVEGTGATENTEYLVMADGPILLEKASLTVHDKITSTGGAIGNTKDNITIQDTKISIDSLGKAIASLDGSLKISGSASELTLSASESVLYAKNGITLDDGVKASVTCNSSEVTAVFVPEGDVLIKQSSLKIESKKTAIAGKYIILTEAYLADPFDGEIFEVSSMHTVRFENEVCANVEFRSGARPTPTPTPTPTPIPPTPTPTPTPEAGIDDFFASMFTTRTMIGGILVIASLIVILILIVSKVRNRHY